MIWTVENIYQFVRITTVIANLQGRMEVTESQNLVEPAPWSSNPMLMVETQGWSQLSVPT